MDEWRSSTKTESSGKNTLQCSMGCMGRCWRELDPLSHSSGNVLLRCRSPNPRERYVLNLMPAKAGIRSSQNIMPTFLNAMWLPWHGLHVNPPEILEQWGNFVSWEHIVGTGAYMIKEYAPGSYISYAKNPNYWAMDPVFPGYKLPYADELKGLIIEDAGTRLAAFRTGQVDWIREVPAKDAQAILERNPEVKYLKVRGWDGFHLSMNQKVPPFEKLEVRKACKCLSTGRPLQRATSKDLQAHESSEFMTVTCCHGSSLMMNGLMRD